MHKTTNVTDLLEGDEISNIGIKISTYNFEAQIRKNISISVLIKTISVAYMPRSRQPSASVYVAYI